MKKSVKLFFCVIMTVIFAVFGVACGKTNPSSDKNDKDLSKEPIIGTWFCDDRNDESLRGYVYYIEVKPSGKDYLNFYLNWIDFGDNSYYHEAERPDEMRRIDTSEDVDYAVFCDFTGISIEKYYYVTMNGNNDFVAVQKKNKFEKMSFTRTDMTWEQFKAAYRD